MAKHQYFVLATTLWQGDTWGPVAGGLSKQEALKVAEEYANDGWSEPTWSEQHQAHWAATQDLKSVVNTRVVSKTAMVRDYGIDLQHAWEQIAYVEYNRPKTNA